MGNGFKGPLPEDFGPFKGLKGKAQPPGNPVVDEHRRLVQLGVVGNGNPPQIIAVGHDQKGHDPNGGMFQGMDSPHEMPGTGFHLLPDPVGDFNPNPLGLKLQLGQVQGHPAQGFSRGNLFSIIGLDLLGDLQSPVSHAGAPDGL